MRVLTRNAPILVTRPNWSRGFQVEYTFKTGIYTSREGDEQREALRQSPRVALRFSTLLSRAGLTRFSADMAARQAEPFATRAEWKRSRLAVEMLAGANTFTVSELPLWMSAGASVILTTSDSEALYEIDSVEGTTITLTSNAERTYPAGTRVHLAYWVRADADVGFTNETDMLWSGQVRYEVIPGTPLAPARKSGGRAYDRRELLLTKPNWRTAPRLKFLQERDVFDPGQGLMEVSAPHRGDNLRLQVGFTGLNAEKSDALIEFFLRQKGKRGAFWMPTWSRDIQPSETVLPAANTFQIDGPDFGEAYADHPVFRVMIAFWPDGTHQINKVVSIAGADSVVTFEDNWSNPVGPETRIMWLPLWRFDTDTLSVEWQTDTIAETQFALRTIYAKPDDQDLGEEFEALRGDVEPAGYGDLAVKTYTPVEMSNVVDLLDYGFTEAEIAAGKVKAFALFTGNYQTGTPREDATTTARLRMVFHATEPSAYDDPAVSPLPGSTVSFAASQTGDLSAQLAPVTVPPGARFMQFRASYAPIGSHTFTRYTSLWAVGRAD